MAVPRSQPQNVTHPEQTPVSRWGSNPWHLEEAQEWECSAPREPHLSEERPVEGDGEGTIHGPHGDIQIHQEPLLLLAVHRGSDPLEHTAGQGCLPQDLDTPSTPGATPLSPPLSHPRPSTQGSSLHWWLCSSLQTPLFTQEPNERRGLGEEEGAGNPIPGWWKAGTFGAQWRFVTSAGPGHKRGLQPCSRAPGLPMALEKGNIPGSQGEMTSMGNAWRPSAGQTRVPHIFQAPGPKPLEVSSGTELNCSASQRA